MNQKDVIIPKRWIVRRAFMFKHGDRPETGEVVCKTTTHLLARAYVRKALGVKHLRDAYAFDTRTGKGFHVPGKDVYHIEHLSLKDYLAMENA